MNRAETFWGRWAGSIAFVALIVFGTIGFARVENARYESCEGGNLLRAGLRAGVEQDIEVTEQTDPALFPDIPPAEFEKLVDEKVERSEERIEVNYADRPCGTHIELPLTGATITFPP